MENIIGKIKVPTTATFREVLEVIDQGSLGAALLVDPDSKKFVAVVTDGDIRRALLKGSKFKDPVMGALTLGKSVTAHVSMPFNEVLSLFSPAVRLIPVLDDNSKVVDLALYDKRRFFPVAEPDIREKEWEYVSDCVLSGWVSSTGKYVQRFEEMFAAYCNTTYAVSCSNGTTALHLALLACGVGPGDEVIVPSLTFIATANAVLYTGAKPVFIDSEARTWNMDPAKIEEKITPKTKAVIPVHLYGHPADMDPICSIAEQHNLLVIEDAAEAHGALYKGQKVGSIGDLGIFSFFGNKIITTGEGGMIVTDNAEFAEKMTLLRDHGMDPQKRYWHTVLGYNYRLTNIQAALGVAQMEKIDDILLRKRNNAAIYTEILAEVPGLTPPPQESWAKSVFWLYSVLIDRKKFGCSRDELMDLLRERGIDTRRFFYPVHQQPVYGEDAVLPVAESVAEEGLSLPSSSKLSNNDIKNIAKTIQEIQQSFGLG